MSALRIAITSGELAPGRHLVETELSDMLQISRGTLREALRQLEQEGLLSAGPRGRLSVRHLDAKEIRDIFAVRAALEPLAARTLCELPDRAQVTTSFRTAVGAMAPAARGTLEERIESVDRHLEIVTAIESGDAMLARQTIFEHMDTAAANLVA